MSNFNLQGTSSSKRYILLSVILCVGCCAFVPVMAAFGVAIASSLAFYFEAVAAGAFVIGLTLYIYHAAIPKLKSRFCKLDCSCANIEDGNK